MKAPDTFRLMREARRHYRMREIMDLLDIGERSAYAYHSGRRRMKYEHGKALERAIERAQSPARHGPARQGKARQGA